VLYSNLRILVNGYLLSEVSRTKIKLNIDDWFNIVYLKYQGQKVSFTDLPEDLSLDRDMALTSIVRPEMQGQRLKTARSFNINDKLLHYMVSSILTQKVINFANLLQEDIFMISVLKNNICINWPNHIM